MPPGSLLRVQSSPKEYWGSRERESLMKTAIPHLARYCYYQGPPTAQHVCGKAYLLKSERRQTSTCKRCKKSL